MNLKSLILVGVSLSALSMMNHANKINLADTSTNKGEVSICDIQEYQGQSVTLRGIVTSSTPRQGKREVTIRNAAECSVTVQGTPQELGVMNELGNKVQFVAEVSNQYLKNVRNVELDSTVVSSNNSYREVEGELNEYPTCWKKDGVCYLRIEEQLSNGQWVVPILEMNYSDGINLNKGDIISIQYGEDYKVHSVTKY